MMTQDTLTTLHGEPTNPSRAAMFAALAAAASSVMVATPAEAKNVTDNDILNFALNLEYLEAEYYLRGVSGQTLDQATSTSLGGSVKGGRQVNFSNPVRKGFVEDIARNELAHVNFLRSALGANAIQRPAIDFDAGFAAVAQAAGLGAFDPFADEESFYIGAFLFEDVGVTAYKGAANMLQDRKILTYAAGILATEAYHGGVIRSVLYKMGGRGVAAAAAISQVRNSLDGPSDDDQPISLGGSANIIPADENSIAYSRTPQQVHNIVFANPAQGVTRGGFFPEGTNGKLVSS